MSKAGLKKYIQILNDYDKLPQEGKDMTLDEQYDDLVNILQLPEHAVVRRVVNEINRLLNGNFTYTNLTPEDQYGECKCELKLNDVKIMDLYVTVDDPFEDSFWDEFDSILEIMIKDKQINAPRTNFDSLFEKLPKPRPRAVTVKYCRR